MRTALYVICVFLFLLCAITMCPEKFTDKTNWTVFLIFGLTSLAAVECALIKDWINRDKKR